MIFRTHKLLFRNIEITRRWISGATHEELSSEFNLSTSYTTQVVQRIILYTERSYKKLPAPYRKITRNKYKYQKDLYDRLEWFQRVWSYDWYRDKDDYELQRILKVIIKRSEEQIARLQQNKREIEAEIKTHRTTIAQSKIQLETITAKLEIENAQSD